MAEELVQTEAVSPSAVTSPHKVPRAPPRTPASAASSKTTASMATPMSTASIAVTDPEPLSTTTKRTKMVMVKKLVPKRRHRLVLSLDGGGIRSWVTLKVLEYVEKELNDAHKNATCKTKDAKKLYKPIPLVDWFDMVAGTASGGILACAMNLVDKETKEPTFPTVASLKDTVYDKLIKTVYAPGEAFNINFFSKKDKNAPIDALLYKYFAQQKLSESRRKLVVTSYEIMARHPYIFRSWQAKQDRNRDFLLDQVTRATSATPGTRGPALLPRGLVRHEMVASSQLFQDNLLKPRRTEIIHAFGLTDESDRQALDRVMEMTKEERADIYKRVKSVINTDDWMEESDDYKLRILLGVRKPKADAYLPKGAIKRHYSKFEASGKNQKYLTAMSGEIFANNPAMIAYTDAAEEFEDDKIVIVSIGTGNIGALDYKKGKDMKAADWLQPALDMQSEGVQDTVCSTLETLAKRKADGKHTDLEFIRVNVDLNVKSDKFFGPAPSTSATMQTKENLKKVDRFADKLIADHKDTLDGLVKLMLYAKPGIQRDSLKLK